MDGEAPPAPRLGFVQGQIRGTQGFGKGERAAGIRAYADTRTVDITFAASLDPAPLVFEQLFGEFRDIGGTLQRREEHEFVAAVATGQTVMLFRKRHKAVRESPQRLVTGLMAQIVVDGFRLSISKKKMP